MQGNASPVLLEAYLAQRDALVRYLSIRTRSPDQAEDIVQEVFLRLQSLSVEDAAEVRSPPAFLFRLASNLFLDRLKQQQRSGRRDDAWRQATSRAIGREDVADEPSAEDAAWARLKLDRVVAALEGLPDNVRRAFRLHKLDGLSHSDTAQAMGVSRSAVEKYISAALKHLLREVGWP